MGFSFGLRFVLWVAYLGRAVYWWVGAAGFGFPGGVAVWVLWVDFWVCLVLVFCGLV